MKSKWWHKKCKKFVLIMIGILMFIACSYAENIVKPDGGNPLLKNLRVTRTWAPTGSCISTLDAKWVEPTAMAEVKMLTTTGQLTALLIIRDITGWQKGAARVYGASDADHASTLWMKSEPIRDLINLAIPGEEVLTLEWWDTYSQYRILFNEETAANIDKLASYVTKMIANDVMSSEWTDDKWRGKRIDKGGGEIRLWHIGKGDTMMTGPYPVAYLFGPDPRPLTIEYIKPSAGGGPHRVVLDQINRYLKPRPFIYEADAYAARSGETIAKMSDRSGVGASNGWAPKGREELKEWWPVAYPSAPGPRPLNDNSRKWPTPDHEKECLKALTELVDNLAHIANKHGLKVSSERKQALFNRFAETDCRVGGSNGKSTTMSWPHAWPDSDHEKISKVKTGV